MLAEGGLDGNIESVDEDQQHQDKEETSIDDKGDELRTEAELDGEDGSDDGKKEPSENVEIRKNEDGEAGTASNGDSGDSTQSDGAGVAPPEHWKLEDKDAFSKAPPDLQNWILAKETDWEKRSTSKFEEAASIRKQYEPLDHILKPFEEVMHQNGMTKDQTIAMWGQTQQSLLENPKETLLQLAQLYNIDLHGDGQETDPGIVSVQNELSTIKQQLAQKDQQTQQTIIEQKQKEIESFFNATDDAGNKKHPYAQEVEPLMAEVMKLKRSQGEDPTLSQVYEAAIYMDAGIRDRIMQQAKQAELKSQKAQEEAQRKAEQEKANQAKQASRQITGSSGSSEAQPAASAGDLRKDLENAIKANTGRI